jgi:general secretion pathway protein G
MKDLCTSRLRARQNEAGFNLMELMVVLAIMALLATLVLPHAMGALGKAKAGTAKTQVEQLSAALDFFKVDNGRYPSAEEGLKALVEAPSGLSTWNGPYLSKPEIPLDSWKRPFVYEPQGESFALFSLGADGKPGGTGENADRGRLPKN